MCVYFHYCINDLLSVTIAHAILYAIDKGFGFGVLNHLQVDSYIIIVLKLRTHMYTHDGKEYELRN